VDHHVGPRSWLPERAASAVTGDATAASGQADTAREQRSPSRDSGNGAFEAPQQQHEAGEPASAANPLDYGRNDSHDYGHLYDYRQEAAYMPDYPSQSGYNQEVSPPAGEGSTVPPYPAELPPQEPAAATTKPGIAAAAYRALPKPKVKTRTRVKTRARVRTQAAEGRRANLIIARVEPWSVMKFSFLMSLVAWVVLFVAVALLYYALSGLGVFASLQRTLSSVTSSQDSAGVNLAAWTSASRVLGYTMLAGAVDIILITVLSTVGAMIYNLVTHLGGGIEVTLKETD